MHTLSNRRKTMLLTTFQLKWSVWNYYGMRRLLACLNILIGVLWDGATKIELICFLVRPNLQTTHGTSIFSDASFGILKFENVWSFLGERMLLKSKNNLKTVIRVSYRTREMRIEYNELSGSPQKAVMNENIKKYRKLFWMTLKWGWSR